MENTNKEKREKLKNIIKQKASKHTSRKHTMHIGLGTVQLEGNRLRIEYRGNMGMSIDDVSQLLKERGIPAIHELKEIFTVIEEDGSPDYMYDLRLQL